MTETILRLESATFCYIAELGHLVNSCHYSASVYLLNFLPSTVQNPLCIIMIQLDEKSRVLCKINNPYVNNRW